jgi:hypothetical protein
MFGNLFEDGRGHDHMCRSLSIRIRSVMRCHDASEPTNVDVSSPATGSSSGRVEQEVSGDQK